MNITIRQATINDVEKVVVPFNDYRMFYEQQSDIDSAREFLLDKFINLSSVIFLAESDEKACGFVQLFPSFSSVSLQKQWILNDLYVDKQFRGAGIGRMLMQTAKEFAIASNSKGLALSTAKTNTLAQNLYESLGFNKDNEFYHYYLKV